jgi:hypothetical protein
MELVTYFENPRSKNYLFTEQYNGLGCGRFASVLEKPTVSIFRVEE